MVTEVDSFLFYRGMGLTSRQLMIHQCCACSVGFLRTGLILDISNMDMKLVL